MPFYRIVKKLLLPCLLLFLLSAPAWAVQYGSNFGYDYEVDDDGNLKITRYTGTSQFPEIPEQIDGFPVRVIGRKAFMGNTNILSVTIPKGLREIEDGEGNFEGAFYGCTNLTLFSDGSNVVSELSRIGANAFKGSGIEDLDYIWENLVTIGEGAFAGCKGITRLILGPKLVEIKAAAFRDCTSLTKIVAENDVLESIGASAFSNCTALELVYSSGGFGNLNLIGESAFADCTNLGGFTFPQKVTRVSTGMFSNCSSLVRVGLHDDIREIGDFAFENCKKLYRITIPGSDPYAATIPMSVDYIGQSAFSQCESLESIVLPDAVTKIYPHTFLWCEKLTSVKVSKALTSIGESAFSGCVELAHFVMPETLTEIGERAFYGCSKLTKAVFLGNAPEMGWGVFYETPSSFTASHVREGAGFTTPEWEGYSCEKRDDPGTEGAGGTIGAGADGTVYITEDLSFKVNDAVYQSPEGDIPLSVSFKYEGEKDEKHVWKLEKTGEAVPSGKPVFVNHELTFDIPRAQYRVGDVTAIYSLILTYAPELSNSLEYYFWLSAITPQ